MENKCNRFYSRDELKNERDEYQQRRGEREEREFPFFEEERTNFAKRFNPERRCEREERELPPFVEEEEERTNFAKRFTPERRCEREERELPFDEERTNFFTKRFTPERRCEREEREFPFFDEERTNFFTKRRGEREEREFPFFEEERKNFFTKRFNPERRQREYYHGDESEDNKFRLRRNLPEFRPEEVKVKVDPVYHTLTLCAKRLSQPWLKEQERCFARKEVIPLPERINLEELRVKYTPRGELLVKAPYKKSEEDSYYKPHYKRRGGEIPLQFAYKDIRGKRQEEMMPTDEMDVQQYLRLLKNSSFPNTFTPKCVRDEKTGKWIVIFEINTEGFRPEEIRVHFQEKKRLLTVEAKHAVRKETKLQGISVKTLCREFILPKFLDGEEITYRVMNTGVLRVKIPCLRNPFKKTYNQEEQGEDYEQFKQRLYKEFAY